MSITSAQRLHTLEILQNIAYSKNDIEYVQNVESLQKTKFKSVADYCYQNWHPIKEQWVLCYRDLFPNLGEMTNNRLESPKKCLWKVHNSLTVFHVFFISTRKSKKPMQPPLHHVFCKEMENSKQLMSRIVLLPRN